MEQMAHWATQLPAWFWILTGFVLGYWAAYIIMALAGMTPIAATHATIRQHGGCEMITGIVSGQSGKFSVTYNGALQPGAIPQWSASDQAIALAPLSDGLTCDVGVPAGLSLPSFTLSAAATSLDGNSVVASASVPVLTPPPVPATAGVIDQIA